MFIWADNLADSLTLILAGYWAQTGPFIFATWGGGRDGRWSWLLPQERQQEAILSKCQLFSYWVMAKIPGLNTEGGDREIKSTNTKQCHRNHIGWGLPQAWVGGSSLTVATHTDSVATSTSGKQLLRRENTLSGAVHCAAHHPHQETDNILKNSGKYHLESCESKGGSWKDRTWVDWQVTTGLKHTYSPTEGLHFGTGSSSYL